MNPIRLLILVMILGVSACATTNDGLSDEALSGDPTAMWADGQKLTVKGEEMIKRGESQIENGRKQIRDGDAKVQRGSDLVSSTRFEYQRAARGTGVATSPKDVAVEAKTLKAIGSRWEDAIDMIRDGNKLVDKGNKTVDQGQSTVRDGRAMVERGSVLMRNAERIRLGEDLLPPVPAQAR